MSIVSNFTLEQYERMVEAGTFDGQFQQRVEFIHGEIRQMNPIGSWHAQVLGDLTDWSYDVTPRKQISIRVQTTLRIPEFKSAPEPDLLWVRRRNYSRKHPEPSDVLLLAEVAESSIGEDRGEKRELYARAKIVDYWIINLNNNTIEVYREPDGSTYQSFQVFSQGDSLTPFAVPAAKLLVSDLLPT